MSLRIIGSDSLLYYTDSDIDILYTYRNHPVLLQGPTSAGKTSLVQWLAKATGHDCLRINNHEHTDLQEYVGMYTANNQGQLVFQEGQP